MSPQPNNPSPDPPGALHGGDARNPMVLAARLAELAPTLTAEQKRAVAEHLRSFGFALPSEGNSPAAETASELHRALAHAPNEPIDGSRVLAMSASLTDFISRIDSVMSDLWRRIVPVSSVRKSASVQTTLARFAAGDTQIARAQVDAEITLLQKITVSLANAIKPAAGRFARRHVDMYSAAAIEQAERDAGARGMGLETRCWKRYQDLCASMDVDAYERELLQLVAEEAERLVRGR